MFSTSPNASSSTSPSPVRSTGWSIGNSPSSFSSTSSTSSTWSQSSSTSANLTCAFPSWPTGSCLSSNPFNSHNNLPSSHISDFDLFPEDLEDDAPVPHMDEAPAPPRVIPMVPTAMPLLPLYAPEKPKSRRRSSKKQRVVKSMTPIAESPLAAPE